MKQAPIFLFFLFNFTSSVPKSHAVECVVGDDSTVVLAACAKDRLTKIRAKLDKYLDDRREELSKSNDDRPELIALNIAQSAWETYRQAHCNGMDAAKPNLGTIRPVLLLGCHFAMTRSRYCILITSPMTGKSSDPELCESKM